MSGAPLTRFLGGWRGARRVFNEFYLKVSENAIFTANSDKKSSGAPSTLFLDSRKNIAKTRSLAYLISTVSEPGARLTRLKKNIAKTGVFSPKNDVLSAFFDIFD